MALVPNGRLRVMKEQSFANSLFSFAQTQQEDVQSQPKPDPRLQIEQTPAANETPPVETAQPPQVATAEPAVETPAAMDTPQSSPSTTEINKDSGKDAEGGESDIKDAWRQILETIGVPLRTIDNIEKQLYAEETNLADNTISGHYMIPTYTATMKVTKEKALSLARQMEQKFGLVSRMKLEGRNWRVDFKSRPKVDVQQGGSSFDELNGPDKQQKAASTLGDMLLARREELFEQMRKIGKTT